MAGSYAILSIFIIIFPTHFRDGDINLSGLLAVAKYESNII